MNEHIFDVEHDHLDRLVGSIESMEGSESARHLVMAIDEIRIYAQLHFQHEESWMDVLDPELFKLHINDHRATMAAILKWRIEAMRGSFCDLDFCTRIRAWLREHITLYDQALVSALVRNGLFRRGHSRFALLTPGSVATNATRAYQLIDSD